MKNDGCLSVVVPTYNELGTLGEILRRVLRQDAVAEVIVVDDGSEDGTGDFLQNAAREEERLHFSIHPTNRGKGAALRTGFTRATMPFVVVQDADLEYSPEDYPRLLAPLLAGAADVVYGSRYLEGNKRWREAFFHTLGNRLFTTLSNFTTGLQLTDMETCYKCFRRELIQGLELVEEGFGFEPEVTAALAQAGVRVVEVPIRYSPRTRSQGKKIGWRDALASLRCIVKS